MTHHEPDRTVPPPPLLRRNRGFLPLRSSLSPFRSRPHVERPRGSTKGQCARTLRAAQLESELPHNWNTTLTIGTNTLTMGIRHTHRQPFLSIRRGGCNEAPSLLGCSQNVPVLERSLQTLLEHEDPSGQLSPLSLAPLSLVILQTTDQRPEPFLRPNDP